MGKRTNPRPKSTGAAVRYPARPHSEPSVKAVKAADADRPLTAAELNRPAHDDVEAQIDSKGRALRAQRKDVFALLYQRKTLTETQYLACRRLETDMIERANCGDKMGTGGASVHPSRRSMITDRQIAAGQCIDWLFGKPAPEERRSLPPMILTRTECVLLDELIMPKRIIGPLKGRWRVQVAQVTGIKDPAQQLETVKTAADRLARSYLAWDNRTQGIDNRSRLHTAA